MAKMQRDKLAVLVPLLYFQASDALSNTCIKTPNLPPPPLRLAGSLAWAAVPQGWYARWQDAEGHPLRRLCAQRER